MERAVLELLRGHSTMALAVCDTDGEITLATDAFERILGGAMPRFLAEAQSLEVFDLAGHRRVNLAELPMARALLGETVVDQVMSLRRPDGFTLYLRCSAGPLQDPDGPVHGAVMLVQDVTAEWVATVKQDELRDRLVTTISHELRTPLTKLIGHAELLTEAAEEGVLPAALRGSVEAISRAGRDLASMAERITHLAHLDAATRLDSSSIDVVELLNSVVESQADAAQALGVHIRTEGPPLVPARVDARLIARAARELLINAVSHAPAGSTVTVELQRLDGHLEIRIADHGPGIPAPERNRLMQPFERGLAAARSSSSTGLGLAVASAVAAAHGGTLALEHNAPGGLLARLCIRRNLA